MSVWEVRLYVAPRPPFSPDHFERALDELMDLIEPAGGSSPAIGSELVAGSTEVEFVIEAPDHRLAATRAGEVWERAWQARASQLQLDVIAETIRSEEFEGGSELLRR